MIFIKSKDGKKLVELRNLFIINRASAAEWEICTAEKIVLITAMTEDRAKRILYLISKTIINGGDKGNLIIDLAAPYYYRAEMTKKTEGHGVSLL